MFGGCEVHSFEQQFHQRETDWKGTTDLKLIFVFQSFQIMATLVNIQHNAPAGQKYSSIRDAGEKTLATHCKKFPQSPDRESFILPILFKSAHPENVNENDL